MNLLYKIIEVHPQIHSIVVRFYTDKVSESTLATQTDDAGNILRCMTDYNMELPIPAPTGADLDAFIVARAPISFLSNQEQILDPTVDTSMSSVTPLVGQVTEKTI